jgi:hypothetical protein
MSKRLIYLVVFVLVLGLTVGPTSGASLWGYYPINENDFTDHSGSNHHGTPLDGAMTVSDFERGWVASFNAEPAKPSRVICGTDDPSAGDTLSVSAWIKWEGLNGFWQGMAGKSLQYGQRRWIFQLRESDGMIQWGGSDSDGLDIWSTVAPEIGEWQHVAGTSDGSYAKVFINGEVVGEGPSGFSPDSAVEANVTLGFGEDRDDYDESFNGVMDEIFIYSRTLSDNQVLGLSNGIVPSFAKADGPSPADGALHSQTWGNLLWTPGDYAATHDVYMSDNFDDVNDGTPDTAAFRGNQPTTMFIVGFPSFPFPDGLVPGTTYYWRIDEVNDADPNSPWKGDIWSFSIPPKTAYHPNPPDGAEFVDPNAAFSWTGGFDSKLHTVYIGNSFDDVNNATGGTPQGATTFAPGPLEPEKVYYWRVDEFDAFETYKGDVWAFTTQGAVGAPQPANGAVDVQMITTLSWTPADNAVSHELYFGTDADAVKDATTASPEYIGPKALGAESYDPGGLAWDSSYAWRVDEVYPDSTVKGLVWSFSTADFILVDDFESYNDIDPPDPNSNRIFDKWIDGFGTTDNGALVGNDLPPYAEQTIVHGGAQSMIYRYDNANKTSWATLTLVYPRDWTEEGVTRLSLWFRGASANAAERMFVALNDNAVVYHEDPTATQKGGWNQWVIDLQAFADQGLNLTSVNTITIGIGTKGSPAAAGGTGTMYFDDIRLIR